MVYLELMYYTEEAKNAQLAIECFEAVLEKSKEKEQLIKASNGKSEGWWWKLVTKKEAKDQGNQKKRFRTWTKNVATLYQDDLTAICYRSISLWWMKEACQEDFVWFHLARSLLRSKQTPVPPAFHYYSSRILFSSPFIKEQRCFVDLPVLLSALEHLEIFVGTVTLKDLHMIQRFVAFPFI
jgi:hypothetical protein